MAKGVTVSFFILAFSCLSLAKSHVPVSIADEDADEKDESNFLYDRNGAVRIFSAVHQHYPKNDPILPRVTETVSDSDVNGFLRIVSDATGKLIGSNKRKVSFRMQQAYALPRIPKRIKRTSSHDTSHSHSSHLLDYILAQVKKGHVTSDVMSHWMSQIRSALSHGSISHHDYHDFMSELQQQTTASHYDGEACCWFG